MKYLLGAPLEFLDDFHGGKSSKRFWGNRLLTIGVMLAIFLYAINILVLFISKIWMEAAILMPQAVNDNCYDIALMFIGAGGGLLFSGIFENKFNRTNKGK